LDTLVNPDQVTGVKIPDIIAFPTGTFQLTADGYITNAAGGDSAAIMVLPLIGDNATVWPIKLLSGAAHALTTVANTNWNSRAAVSALYGAYRPVSMVCELEFVGNSSTDAGTLWGTLVPSSGAYAVPADVATAQNYPGTEEMPLRNGIRILWKPEDNTNFEFVNSTGGAALYPYLVVGVTGVATANLATNWVRYHICANFEATALVDTVNIAHTEPSPFSMDQVRSAFEWAAQVGNNIFTLYQNAGPYVAAGASIAGAMGYQVPGFLRGGGGRNRRRIRN